jgi:hypothetical protein
VDVHSVVYLPPLQSLFKKPKFNSTSNVHFLIMYPKSGGSENTFSQWIGITKLLDPVMKPLDVDVDYNGNVYGLGHKVVEDILKPTTKKWPFLVVNVQGGGYITEIPLISSNPLLFSTPISCKPIGLSMNVIVIGATNNSLSVLLAILV